MIDYDVLRDWAFPVVEHTYTTDDTIRYALSLGAGSDPTDSAELRFVNDILPGTPVALPTMAVVLGFPGSWMANPETGIRFDKILHGEERIDIHHPLPAAGTVTARHRVTRIVDKGEGRGATITYVKELHDKADGRLLATVTHTTFARGDGGFSVHNGKTDPAPGRPRPVPDGAPDLVIELPTLPQQALMYRLCADRNPLHSEPNVAREAGFARPILHGLCTYGLAQRAILNAACGQDPTRLASLFARFSAPVYPGETITFDLYLRGTDVLFRARVKARDAVVLDHGLAELRGGREDLGKGARIQ